MDTAQWPQEIVVKPIEDIVVTNTCPKPPPASAAAAALDQRKPRPQKEQALNCPRCHSINTKFCYYNNYSLTQPRYFCKTCRRYWTEGGSLRNIPVGGGSRKNKRSSSSVSYNSSSPSANSTKSNNNKLPDLVVTPPSLSQSTCTTQNPKIIKIHEGQDLNLGFPTPDFRNISELVIQQNNNSSMSASASSCSSSASTTTTVTASTSHLSALELLTGMTPSSTGGLQYSFMPVPADPNSTHVYSTCGFPLHDFKPALNFSLDHGIGGGSGYASLHQGVNHQETTSGRLLFPFEDLKQVPSNGTNPAMDQNNNKEQHGNSTTGYWTGMLGGGSWFWGVSCRNIHLCLKAGLTLTMKQVIITSIQAREESKPDQQQQCGYLQISHGS